MLEERNASSSVDDELESSGHTPYSTRPETYIVPVVFGIVFIVGVTGNGCLISILCRNKAMRSVPNTFVFNLALGDLLVLLCTVPFTSTVYTFDSWPFGEFICRASEFVKDMSVGVTVFTLVALSHDRYTAVVHPVQSYAAGPKWKQITVILAIIWIVSIALALPGALFSHLLYLPGPPIPENEKQYDANGTLIGPSNRVIVICYPFPEEFGPYYPKIVVLLRALLHYLLPLLIIGTLYAIMASHLLRSVETIPGQALPSTQTPMIHHRNQLDSATNQMGATRTQQPEPNQNLARRKVVKMALSFVVLFTLCFLPMHIFFLWFYFDPTSFHTYNNFWHVLRIVGFVLAYVNSCINSIALYCVSTNFRQQFNGMLCCCSTSVSNAASGSLSSGRTATSSGLSQSNQRIAKVPNLPSGNTVSALRIAEANVTSC